MAHKLVWTPRARRIRRTGTYISSLVVGAIGFLWPGGANILMIMGAVMLFGAAILDEEEEGANILMMMGAVIFGAAILDEEVEAPGTPEPELGTTLEDE